MVTKNRAKRGLFFAASAAKFWKSDSSSAWESVFPVFLAIFLVAQLPSKRSVLVHKNSVASYQRCRVVEASSHALWRVVLGDCWVDTPHINTYFVQVCCVLSTVTVTPVETRTMSTEALLSKTVSVKIHTKAKVYDLAFREVHAHPAVAVCPVGDGSDKGDSSRWIVLSCERYWLAGVGGRGSGRRALGGQDSPNKLFWISKGVVRFASQEV